MKLRKTAEKLLLAQLKKHALQTERAGKVTRAGPCPANSCSQEVHATATAANMQAALANGAAPAQLPSLTQPAAGGAAPQNGAAAEALEDAIKVKSDDEDEAEGATGLQPDSSIDALLAQQLASQLEQGSYAKVPRLACSPPFRPCTRAGTCR